MIVRNFLLAGVAVAALASCAPVAAPYGGGLPGYGGYREPPPLPPIAEPAPPISPPVAAEPPNDDNGGVEPAPLPRRHYRQPPVTEPSADEPPVAEPPPQPSAPPEPPPVITRPSPPRSPSPPSNGFFSGPAGCAGRWWDLCHIL
jgi:hypothetical protein